MHAAHLDTPTGRLTVIGGDTGIRRVGWNLPTDGCSDTPHPVVDEAIRQLREYLDGTRREFDLPLDPEGTPFQQKVWDVLRAIPYGETITYGEQARRLGDPRRARAVGAANGRNPIAVIVPCHRVVGADGSLTGYAGGVERKDWLLRHERGAAVLF